MTNLDETQQEEKRKILIAPVRQSEGGENKNQLAALLSAGDGPTCQSSSDGGSVTHLAAMSLWPQGVLLLHAQVCKKMSTRWSVVRHIRR